MELHCHCEIALYFHNRMLCWPIKWATPESAGGSGNTQSCRVLLKTGPCAFHKVLRSGIGNIDRSICASHPNKDGGLQTYCGNSSNTCIKATVEESYMCFPRCQLWSICMAICGTWQGCQQPYPKKCPTPWKATSREFSPNLEQFTQERKLLAGPKLLDQAVLPKALWETAFYDVQSEYLVLPWIPLRARYLTEAWNDDWNHQFWVTKTDSCTVCTCNQKGVELQALPSTGCAHLPSLPHPKLQKGCKQKLRAPVVNAANGFGFLEGQAPVWRLKLVALDVACGCRYMGICGEPEEQTGKFGYRTLEFCLVLSLLQIGWVRPLLISRGKQESLHRKPGTLHVQNDSRDRPLWGTHERQTPKWSYTWAFNNPLAFSDHVLCSPKQQWDTVAMRYTFVIPSDLWESRTLKFCNRSLSAAKSFLMS